MNRREFIKKAGIGVASGVFHLSTILRAEPDRERPNILFLFADDWGRYAGVYRDPNYPSISDVVETPNINRLGREGVVFRNAFNPVPSCTPCRGSILTGQYFWRNGRAVNLGGGDWPKEPGLWESLPKFPVILESLGYITGYSGKVGVDWWEDAHRFYGKSQVYARHGNNIMKFSQYVNRAESIEAGKKRIFEEVRNNFRDLLEDRRKGQPFFYWFGPMNAHRPWIRGSGRKIWGIEPHVLKGKIPPFWPDVGKVREDVADYLGEVQAFDGMVGVIVEELRRAGELDNTLIVATGDNGIPGFPRAKRNLYDAGVHAPLIIRWADRVVRGRIVDDFVNLMDLAPTFVEAAGGTPPEVMTGRSLVPVLLSKKSGIVDPARDFVVTGRERHTQHYPMRGIRTKDFLYIRNFKLENRPAIGDSSFNADKSINIDGGPTKDFLIEHADDPEVKVLFKLAFDRRPTQELYDLEKDPHQMNNVAGKPEYAEVQRALSKRLMIILADTNDPRVMGDGSTFDKPPYVNQRKTR